MLLCKTAEIQRITFHSLVINLLSRALSSCFCIMQWNRAHGMTIIEVLLIRCQYIKLALTNSYGNRRWIVVMEDWQVMQWCLIFVDSCHVLGEIHHSKAAGTYSSFPFWIVFRINWTYAHIFRYTNVRKERFNASNFEKRLCLMSTDSLLAKIVANALNWAVLPLRDVRRIKRLFHFSSKCRLSKKSACTIKDIPT